MPELEDPEIFRAIVEGIQTGVYLVDRERKIVFWNAGAEKISGYLRHEVVGRFCRDKILVHCDHTHAILCGEGCPLAATMSDGKTREAHLYLRHKAGYRVPVHVQAMPMRNREGTIIGAAEIFAETSTTRRVDRRDPSASGRVDLDEITGLFRPEIMLSRLRENIADFGEHGKEFSILLVEIDDLDRFEASHGREAEHAIRRVVAHTVANNLRLFDVAGSWHDKRFLAILQGGSASTQAVSSRVQDLVNCSGIEWWGDQLSVTVSLGEVTAKLDDTAESILERVADSLFESTPKSRKPHHDSL